MYSVKKLISFHRNKLKLLRFTSPDVENKFQREFKSRDDFVDLFNYFQMARKDKLKLCGTRLLDASFVSKNGKDMDAIEGVTRYLPYWAAHAINMQTLERSINLEKIFRVIRGGVSESSSNYWGEPDNYHQILCEASDVAITLWMIKDEIDNYLCEKDKEDVIGWFSSAISKEYHDNNWLLFKITVELFLKSIGMEVNVSMDKYQELKSWYAEDGWFRDGRDGEIDYYSCWGFSYGLFWINEIDPNFDPIFIKNTISKLATSYALLVNNEGIPAFFGRSVPYRLSASTPLICAVNYNPRCKYVAGNVLYKTFSHFSKNGAFENGMVSSGYYKSDTRFVDNYSGPNSSLWSLRVLVISEYLYNKGEDVYNIDSVSIEGLVERKHKKTLCNGLISVYYDDDNVTLENKTLKYKGYSKSILVAIKVYIKSIFDCSLFFRKERQVRYRENFVDKFSSDNAFYMKDPEE